MVNYCYAVCGPPGSGKSAFCETAVALLKQIGRNVKMVNLDPANDRLPYTADVNIDDLIQISEVMEIEKLGPNGALMYAMEHLEKNINWLLDEFKKFGEGDNFIFLDFPGQVELFVHHESVKRIFGILQEKEYKICTVYLVDSWCCRDPGTFISFLTTTLASMMQLAVPRINVLSKWDLLEKFEDQLVFGLEFYTEVLDLSRLVDILDDDPITGRYKELNRRLADLIQSYGLVSFLPCTVQNLRCLFHIIKSADNTMGYCNGNEDEKFETIMRARKDEIDLKGLVLNEKCV